MPQTDDSIAETHVTPPVSARLITGTVTDTAGEPVTGAVISVNGKPEVSAMADIDGAFSIKIDSRDSKLNISAVGYYPASVNVSKSKDTVDAVLKSSMSQLDEVIVVGYATQKKVDLTGAVSSVSTGALEDRPVLEYRYVFDILRIDVAQRYSGHAVDHYQRSGVVEGALAAHEYAL